MRRKVSQRSRKIKATLPGRKIDSLTAAQPWACPTCKSLVSTPYCPACGERPLTENDLTLRSLFNQLFHAFSSIDSRLIRSFSNLLRHPGLLTAAYVRGQRMPYTGPFQLFLVANILFFAMQSLTNTNIVSSQLDSHLHNQDWSALAQRLVSHRLEEVQTTVDFYAPIFNQAVVLNAKSLIILMVEPLYASAANAVLLGAAAVRGPHRVFSPSLYLSAAVLRFVGDCGDRCVNYSAVPA